jgi:chromosome segregation ATPase
MLEKFTASASEQGGLLLDAQRDMEAAVERKIAEVSSELTDSLDGMRKEIASIDRTPSVAAVDLEPLRKEVFTGLAAFGEELDAETKKMREEIAARMEEIGARLSAMDATQRKLEARVEDALRSTDERLAMIQTLLERAAGMEERAAARMVDLLATAFAELRTAPPSAPPTLVAS